MGTITGLVPLLLLLALGCASLPVNDDPFYQVESEIFLFSSQPPTADWTVLPVDRVVKVEDTVQNGAYLVTPSSVWLFSYTDESVINLNLSKSSYMNFAVHPSSYDFVLVGPTLGTWCQYLGPPSTPICNVYQFQMNIGNVNDVTVTLEGDVWVGSTQGLYVIPHGSHTPQKIQDVNDSINVVAYNTDDDTVAAGSATKLWRQISNLGQSYWAFWWNYDPLHGTRNTTSLHFDAKGRLWIGNPIAIEIQEKDLTFTRISGNEGLPYNNILSIGGDPNSDYVWIGTTRGAIRHNIKSKEWNYYYGSRYLPFTSANGDQPIISLTVNPANPDTTLLVTSTGLSLIKFKKWTLKEKADYFQTFVAPRHNYYGLVASSSLTQFGNPATLQQEPSDNDGLWSSIYLVSQCFRYAVTKDPDAKKEAWNVFLAMKFLVDVTGIKGLMARSVKQTSTLPGKDWHFSKTHPGWAWQGDASSDEVVGHMFAYPIVYHLVAETQSEKQLSSQVFMDIISGIVDHNYYLIGYYGNHTTWGVWNPININDQPFWYDVRGVNSNQILSYLVSAYSMSKNTTFLDSFFDLCKEHGYNLNIRNLKIMEPDDINYSDDELTYLPYFTYAFSGEHHLKEDFDISINRTWKYTKRVQSSLWNVVYGAWQEMVMNKQNEQDGSNFELDAALRCLREWPTSLIDWPYNNTQRIDYVLNTDVDRGGQFEGNKLYPWSEQFIGRWNGDPFELVGGSGYEEEDPGAWLLPYWMARFFKFIA
eukprot:TRINITY_DN7161_c0_g1_i1.p1 TRINITY_DN7161_c0_g1~~TRINITY_DN7161_c0_g1_i1.p1  ORF type:complete len:757 (+),score=117.74 TRINITY_DN7161_c0_g1_i1:13-2283(+)